MSNRHFSADIHVDRLSRWSRNKDQIDIAGDIAEGIDKNFILFALNQGKQQIQNAIANLHPNFFASYVTAPITTRTLSFPIPDSAINSNRIIELSYSETDVIDTYRKLRFVTPNEITYGEGSPCFYTILGNNISVMPVPETGFYRFLIQKRDPTLDLKRGTVETITQSGGQLTEIVLTANELLNNVNITALQTAEWVTAVDFKGDILLDEIPIVSYTSSTRTLSVVPNGRTYNNELIGGGQTIVIGDRASTHSMLPIETQTYYVEWAKIRILHNDASVESINEMPFIVSIKQTVLESMAEHIDMQEIPQFGSLTGSW
jgi:hypothetical protein